jgi:23S rRNA (pseudouridine1915-N3)-methyltransferase
MKAGPQADLMKTYLDRMTWPMRLVEVEPRAMREADAQKAADAEAIRSKLPPGAVIVALDERGRTVTSPDFAAWIGRQQTEGAQNIAFVIGGADGLHESLRAEARLVLAFGQMTWPHMLARVMLMEQLYRAQQILAGHPYHRV